MPKNPKTSKPKLAVNTHSNGETDSAGMYARLALNALLSRGALRSALSSDKRDIDASCHYPSLNAISETEYLTMYRRGPGNRVVNIWPKETWKVPPEIYETEDTNRETAFEQQIDILIKEQRLIHYFKKIDRLSRIGRFGIMLLGLDDGKELSEPIEGIDENGKSKYRQEKDKPGQQPTDNIAFPPEKKPAKLVPVEEQPPNRQIAKQREPEEKQKEQLPDMPRKLLYLRCFDESLVSVSKWQTEKTSDRYGKPLMYKLQLADLDEENGLHDFTKSTDHQVHWSRVIHVSDNCDASEIYGNPAQEPVWNNLLDLKKCVGGSAEMLWRGGFPGLAVEIDPDVAAADPEFDEATIRESLANYSDDLQRYVAIVGAKLTSLAPGIADPTPNINAQWQQIAIIMDVPMRVLMGSEQGRLAADQDSVAWNGRCKERQKDHNEPTIVRQTIDRLMDVGVVVPVEEYFCDWPDLYNPSPDEKASTAQKITEALAKYVGGDVATVFPPKPYLTLIIGLTQEEADAVLAEAEQQVVDTEDPEEDSVSHRIVGPNPAKQAEIDSQREKDMVEIAAKAKAKNTPPPPRK